MPQISFTNSLVIQDILIVFIISLLVFISIAVAYLSIVSFKDKRRMKKATSKTLKK